MFKMKKLLSGLLAIMLVVMMVPVTARAEGTTIEVSENGSSNELQSAVDSVTDSTPTTIVLMGNVSGDGVKVPRGRNITFDLNGYTYTFNGTSVGSSGTETLGFQLLKNSTIVIKNGKLVIDGTESNFKRVIQNYADLTLIDVTIDATASVHNASGISTCNGTTVIEGSTSILVSDNSDGALFVGSFAGSDYTGVNLTMNTTGTVQGAISIGSGNGASNTVSIQNVTHVGSMSVDDETTQCTISGGAYSDTTALTYATGEMKQVNGMWVFGSAASAPVVAGCNHVMDYIVTKEPTETEDGLIMYKCTKCSHATQAIPICGHGVFLKNAAKAILNAKAGENVVINTDRYISFNEEVFEAIKARTDVTVTVNYVYRGAEAKENRSFTVAGGTDLTTYLSEDGFCGFEYIVYQLALAAMK